MVVVKYGKRDVFSLVSQGLVKVESVRFSELGFFVGDLGVSFTDVVDLVGEVGLLDIVKGGTDFGRLFDEVVGVEGVSAERGEVIGDEFVVDVLDFLLRVLL